MNLRNFLLEVDKITGQMSTDQLKAFIHEKARLLSESKRESYLKSLELFLSEVQSEEKAAAKRKKAAEDFEQECIRLQKEIYKIENGELYLEAESSYEYDEWYDDDEEFIFADPHGVKEIIERAGKYIHRCIDCEKYTYGYKIAEQLILLEVQAEGDEWDGYYDTLSMVDLSYHDLIDMDYKQMVIDGLYLTYRANDLEERADALYGMFENSHLKDISLEMVMQNGEELTDVTEFLPVWTAYLGKINTPLAQSLLKEALELAGDPEVLLSSARQYYVLHPALYEQYLDFVWNMEAHEKLFAVGNEALEKIDTKYVVRSQIAKRLSALALEDQKRDKAGKYWLEAFRSETTVTNYMRILMESADSKIFSEQIRQIYQDMYKRTGTSNSMYAQSGELKINNPGLDTVHMLAFFGGEFQYVKKHAMNVTAALGWSSTFMKCGLAAFLLLLLNCDELQEGGREMCRRIVSDVNFDKEEYQRCTNRKDDLSSAEWFWECFKKWKASVEISDAQKQKYLQWIEELIKKRVNRIMEANRRNYYGECASYIAALGEVMESRGEQGAKQRILLEYKEQYFRRRAFHEELRKYGMPDTRKRR